MRLRPYAFFFLLSLSLLLFGYLTIREGNPLSINAEDSYLVPDKYYFFIMASVLFGLWVIYALTDRYIYLLNRGMVWIHALLTLVSLVGYIYLVYWGLWYPSTEESQPFFELYEERMANLSYVVLVFLIGQLMFPLNIFRSVLLRARRGMPEEDFEA